MRTLMTVKFDTEVASRAAADGTLSEIQGEVFARLQPEAAYFAPLGTRTSHIVFDLDDPSAIPGICEPLFQRLGASIEMTPVMNLEDLQKGLAQIG